RQHDGPALLRDLFGVVIDRRHVDRADVGNHRLAVDGAVPLEQPAVDAGLTFGAGLDQPVVLRPAPLVNLPAEQLAVEADGPVRVLAVDLEMNDARHSGLLPWIEKRTLFPISFSGSIRSSVASCQVR